MISVGFATGLLPDMTLKHYAMTVMREDEAMFDRISPPTVSNVVCLRHLNSLFRLLEENTSGTFIDRILPGYVCLRAWPCKLALVRASFNDGGLYVMSVPVWFMGV